MTLLTPINPQVVDYEVIKKWDDEENQDGKRPDKITIHLMKTVAGTTTEVESKEISSADNWRYRFSQLPKYEAGQEITYSVTEDAIIPQASMVVKLPTAIHQRLFVSLERKFGKTTITKQANVQAQ